MALPVDLDFARRLPKIEVDMSLCEIPDINRPTEY